MRHTITWQQITSYTAELDITTAELAAWAVDRGLVLTLAASRPAVPHLDRLARSIDTNRHLRARLLQLYALEVNHVKEGTTRSTAPTTEPEKTKSRPGRNTQPSRPQTDTGPETRGES